MNNKKLTIGLISISDRASTGIYLDKGIPTLQQWLEKVVLSPFKTISSLIPDDRQTIEKTLKEFVDQEHCDLILTTGGTGPSRRDVTPEATLAVATREMPGFGERMREISSAFVPTAILSRQVGVLREIEGHAALIINLPGQPKAIEETLEGLPKKGIFGIFAAVPYCIELIGGPFIETDPTYVKAFRPKSAPRPQIAEAIIEEPREKADSTVIMLHGLGADNSDFEQFRDQLEQFGADLSTTRFVLPNAEFRPISMNNGYEMRGWFDLFSLDSVDKEDKDGLLASVHIVKRLIAEEISKGIAPERIVLGGFSQGGCVSLLAAYELHISIGGFFAISSYLPLASQLESAKASECIKSPIFMGYGLEDSVLAPAFTEMSANNLLELGATNLEAIGYPNCEHHMCEAEMEDLAKFINSVLHTDK